MDLPCAATEGSSFSANFIAEPTGPFTSTCIVLPFLFSAKKSAPKKWF